MENTPNIVVTF